jgi:D-alanyl-D-alanine carboxypeptidase (penicillin-binding protein 5/6)
MRDRKGGGVTTELPENQRREPRGSEEAAELTRSTRDSETDEVASPSRGRRGDDSRGDSRDDFRDLDQTIAASVYHDRRVEGDKTIAVPLRRDRDDLDRGIDGDRTVAVPTHVDRGGDETVASPLRVEHGFDPDMTVAAPIRIGFDDDLDDFDLDMGEGRRRGLSLRPIPLRGRLPGKDQPQRRAMYIGIAVGVIAAMITVIALRATRPFPEPKVELAGTVTPHLPGSGVRLAWPSVGQAALAVEGQGGIGSSGPTAAQPIASITKVMTAYLVLTDHPLAAGQQGPMITMPTALAASLKQRIALGQSLVKLPAGARISEYNALRALLLPSADNIADLLAQWDAGSTSRFVARMNSTARRLGMTHTHYVDASGFDQGSVSSAVDLLKLGEAVTKLPVFTSIVDQRTAEIPGIGAVGNYNTLLGTDGVDGIKTGSTTPAGGCLLFSAHYAVDGQSYDLLGVVLGQRGSNILAAAMSASKALVASAEQAMRPMTVLDAGVTVGQLRPAYGKPVRVVTASPLQVPVLPGKPVMLTTRALAKPMGHRNNQVGWLTAASGQRVALIATHAVPAPSFWQRLGHIL